MEGQDFVRGDNERSVYYNEDHDVLDLTWVDDNYLDAEEDDIHWASDIIGDRFECKELEFVTLDDEPTDYLGMGMSMTPDQCSLSMEAYIASCLEQLGWSDLKPAEVPMTKDIDGTSSPLCAALVVQFHTALGCLGWLHMTGLPVGVDVSQRGIETRYCTSKRSEVQ